MPDLYIITGSNGAGKSSVGSNYLPQYIYSNCEVFDGDKWFIQKQKSLWQQGITAIKEAKNLAIRFVNNLFEELVNKAISTHADFTYEGHFTNEATWEIPKQFKSCGYTIHIIFLGLSSTDLSESRVVERVKHGGHYVQPDEIRNNFYGNLEKLNKYYTLFNTVTIIDTSEPEHKLLAYLKDGEFISSVTAADLPDWFINGLPAIHQAITKQ